MGNKRELHAHGGLGLRPKGKKALASCAWDGGTQFPRKLLVVWFFGGFAAKKTTPPELIPRERKNISHTRHAAYA
jgi:hypothetical protein